MGPRPFEQLLRDTEYCLAHPNFQRRELVLSQSVGCLGHFREEWRGDEGKSRAMIGCARVARGGTGSGRAYAEQQMLGHLECNAWDCCGQVEEALDRIDRRTRNGSEC